MGRQDENIAYLIAMPAIILALIFKLIPLFGAFKLPFVDYKFTMGIGGSPYIGLKNFSDLFSTYYFRRLVSNTLILKFGFVFISGIIAFILGWALSHIEKRWFRKLFIILFTIPFFIPASVFSHVIFYILRVHPLPFLPPKEALLDPERFRSLYILIESLRASGVLSIIVFSFIENDREDGNTNGMVAAKAVALFLFVQISSLMTINLEMLNEFINPLVYNAADTIDTFIFRNGIINADINRASSLWILRFIIQLLITIGVYYTVKHTYYEELLGRETLVDDSPSEPDHRGVGFKKNKSTHFLGIILCIIYAALLLIPFLSALNAGSDLIVKADGNKFANIDIFSAFIRYIIITLFAAMLNFVITLLFAYPLTIPHSKGKILYEIFLLILLVSGQGGVHEYLYYRSLGMINTIYPYILNGFFSIMNVLVLGSIYTSEYSFSNFREYTERIHKPALALAGFQFITMWNSYYPSQIMYISNPEVFSPVMLFKNIAINIGENFNVSFMLLGLLISLPSLIIGIFICVFADERVFMTHIRN